MGSFEDDMKVMVTPIKLESEMAEKEKIFKEEMNQTITDGDRIYILTEPKDSDRNIYCYKSERQIWQIEEAPKIHTRNYFTSVYIRNSDLYAYCINGIEVLINKDSGKFLKTELIK